MKLKRILNIVALVLAATTFAVTARAGDNKFGVSIPADATKATLAEIIAKPDAYAGKDVVVEGAFAGACGDGDFFFKDKFDMIEADPPKPEVCSLKKGTRIRLYGLVKIRGGSEEGSEKKEVSVRIVGKAVEVIK